MDFRDFLNAHRTYDHGKAIDTLKAGKPLPESTLEQLNALKNLSLYDAEMRIINAGVIGKILQSSESFADGTQAASLEEVGYWLELEMTQIKTMLEQNDQCEIALNWHERVLAVLNERDK